MNINDNTKAIVTVNLYGNMPNYEEIEKICESKSIFLLEDAAESLGSKYNKKDQAALGIFLF